MGSVARVLKRLSWSDRAAVISLLQEQGIIEQPADSHILGAMVLARMKTLNQTGTCGKAGGQRLADLQAKANLARLVPPEVKEQRRVTAFAKASGMDRAAVAQAASENATALTTDPTGRLLYFTERLDQLSVLLNVQKQAVASTAGEETVYVLTDGNDQSAPATQAALYQVIAHLKHNGDMDLQELFMWSDGCAGQFKGLNS
ncbi:hypothetical protein QJQ45_001197 [Haematococcus lacustris]|nr:hypothetical protein QJQ45_001197 [Haematococcus lacustris]